MRLRTTISYLLFPLTMWYAVGVAVRNILYGLGMKKQQSAAIATVGVGNLCVGGSGKTPHTEYMLELLSPMVRTAVLSRGYKRQSAGYQQDDGSHDAGLLGDEAAMVAQRHPETIVAVCKDRCEGIARLSELPDEERPEVVLLDDAFQYRRLKPNINVLLTEYRRPYSRDRILPYGSLREFRGGCYRASVVVVTKSPARLNPIERHNLEQELKLKNYQRVYFSYLNYLPLRTLDGQEAKAELRGIDRALVVTGIAHPSSLLDEVRLHCKAQHLAFPDHHDYTQHDVERIAEAFKAMPGERKIVLTTEKDAVKLCRLKVDFPLYVQPVKVAFHKDAEADFDSFLVATVKENISFLRKLNTWARPKSLKPEE
ncbi:MAG: tetraacyldisaccharide 4'-kinase [Bacteroidales bacterium]|nr:tetraacyldisaccharide 4'-kinase [Bacteroidales bacterium]